MIVCHALGLMVNQYNDLLNKLAPYLRYRGLFLLCLGLCCFSPSSQAGESGVEIRNVTINTQYDQYELNAEIDFQLSQVALDALRNGVSLQWILRVQAYRQRRFLWDQKLLERKRHFRLRHHALMKMYQLSNLNTGKVDYFVTLEAALQAMGTVKNMLVIDMAEMREGNQYFAVIEVLFERNRLPVPLQYATYFNSEWLLSSKQYIYAL